MREEKRMESDTISTFTMPAYRYELHITDFVVIQHEHRPMWFWRMMQYLLLGWEWTKLGEKK